MMNDKGNCVLSVGAPGSPARVRVQYPALIDRLNSVHAQEGNLADCIDEIRQAGITDKMTTTSLIEVSYFGSDTLYLDLVKSGMM